MPPRARLRGCPGRVAMKRQGFLTWFAPVWMVLGSIISVQFGAAIAKSVFDNVDPTAVAWLRMVFSALVFVAIARPRLRGRTRRQWVVMLAYGVCMAMLSWALYQSFSRIPLGLAVTIEFLGPLGVAVATSRRLRDVLWALLAAAGVVLLGGVQQSLDLVGIGFALLAGASWAGYILLSGPVARDWSGLTGATAGSVIGALGWAVPGVVAGGAVLLEPWVLLVGLVVGILSSAIPTGLELMARRRMAPGIFSVLMSLHPAFAALSALLLLGERLTPVEIVAMVCVVLASIGATGSMGRPPSDPPSDTPSDPPSDRASGQGPARLGEARVA